MPHSDDRPSTSARSRELRELYEAFNAREIDRVLAAMTADVQWPNGWEGGQLEGREAVRDYWIRQWAGVRLSLTPVRFQERGDGRIEVDGQASGPRHERIRPCSRRRPPCVRVRRSSGPSDAGRAGEPVTCAATQDDEVVSHVCLVRKALVPPELTLERLTVSPDVATSGRLR